MGKSSMIVINGDSYTGGVPNGDNFPHHHQNLWPGKFEELTKKPILNISEGGSSNYRLFRTTIEQIYKQPSITHIIIGWSHKDRFEFPHKTGNYIKVKPGGNLEKKNHAVHKDLADLDLKYLHHIYYNTMFNEEQNISDFLHFVLILQDLCNIRGIKLVNFQSFNDNFKNNEQFSSENKKLFSKVNISQWIPSTMKKTLTDEGYAEYKLNCLYPNEQGNIRWAELINNFIEG
jgi:hypothetical protein